MAILEKLVLIMPKGASYRYKEKHPPGIPDSITLPALASSIPKEWHIKVEIYDETIEKIVKESISGDIVAISGLTSSIKRAYTYAAYFRSKGITVIIGGVHATLNTDEALEHADSVVCGLAYQSWPQLLLDYKTDNLKRVYRQENLNHYTIPCIDRDAYKSKSIHAEKINSIQASYGCRNACEFCVQPHVCGGTYQRPVEEVINEIKEIKSTFVEFYDPNLFQNEDYAYRLCEALIPLNKKWGAPANIRISDNEKLLEIACRSGFMAVLIGFESVNQKSLFSINKGINKVNAFIESINRLRRKQIMVFGSFVLGLDGDDRYIFQQTLNFLRKAEIHRPRFTINTPFPGTPYFYKMKKDKRIIENDWSLYDCCHVVIKPANMSAEELQEGFYWLCNEAYKHRPDLPLHHYYKNLPKYTKEIVADCSDI